MSLFKNNSEIRLYSRLNTTLNSGQVFEYLSLHIRNRLLQFIFRLKKVLTWISIWVSMLVFGQIQIRLEIGICATTILGFQYRPSTRLRYKWFVNCLDKELWIGTPICRSLLFIFLFQFHWNENVLSDTVWYLNIGRSKSGHTIALVSTQEKGSKRTIRNYSKWNAFVRTNLIPQITVIPPCPSVLNKLLNPEPCFLLIT